MTIPARSAIASLSLLMCACASAPVYDFDEPGPADGGGIVESVDVDVDERLVAESGVGVGVFVEYSAARGWHIFTTCDSLISGYLCVFDVIASTTSEATITSFSGDQLEPHDYAQRMDDGAIRWVAVTAEDKDGLYLQLPQSEVLRLDVLTDGVADPRVVYWVGNGAIHEGAPSMPLDMLPRSP
ncbi:MAG: hypothetical protein HRU17_13410 [Polyangiaceae bacterium]|nr:hypothetical protein [Polyangiaceae bacterium]